MKYRDWLQRWLSTGTITFKSATKNKYEQIIRCHINPFLGNREINDIAAEDLRNFSLRLFADYICGRTWVLCIRSDSGSVKLDWLRSYLCNGSRHVFLQ